MPMHWSCSHTEYRDGKLARGLKSPVAWPTKSSRKPNLRLYFTEPRLRPSPILGYQVELKSTKKKRSYLRQRVSCLLKVDGNWSSQGRRKKIEPAQLRSSLNFLTELLLSLGQKQPVSKKLQSSPNLNFQLTSRLNSAH